MLDLRIWILTHPQSRWDAEFIQRECLAAFTGQDLAVEVSTFFNMHPAKKSLTAFEYLSSAFQAQLKVGNFRLAKRYSKLTLVWHLRQLLGLGKSIIKLISVSHRLKVKSEASRAAQVSIGHMQMWELASKDSAKLHLFLEDDVVLIRPESLVSITRLLSELSSSYTNLICDVSHSYPLGDLGIHSKFLEKIGNEVKIFDFPFTNTLAASFLSPSLLELTVAAIHEGRVGGGLGIDLDLAYLWSKLNLRAFGCESAEQIFRQRSDYKSQKI